MSALRILSCKLLLWRRRLTGAINRSGGYKNIRSGFAGRWRKGGSSDGTGLRFYRRPPPRGSFTCQLYFPDLNRIDRHLCEAALIIYGPSISSGGRGVERAKFLRNTLDSAGADANLAGNFEDALLGPHLTLASFFNCWAVLWLP